MMKRSCATKIGLHGLCPSGKTFYSALLIIGTLLPLSLSGGTEAMLEERRQLLRAAELGGEAAVPRLIAGLSSEHREVRMTAARLAMGMGAAAQDFYTAALRGSDARVRYVVVGGIAESNLLDRYWLALLLDEDAAVQRKLKLDVMRSHALPSGARLDMLVAEIADAYADADPARKVQLLGVLAVFDDLPARGRELLLAATRSEDERVRAAAYRTLLVVLTNEWPDVDGLLRRVAADPVPRIAEMARDLRWVALESEQVRLPVEGWRFKTDPDGVGEARAWYAVDFDDSGWRTDVEVETSWQEFMEGGLYVGPAWYRRAVDAPQVRPGQRVWLHFEGADEEGWVWLNGEYVGAHAEGRDGWNWPFEFDVTDIIKPGESNQLTVRVRNTGGGGGLWAPVRIRVTDPPSKK